MNARSSSLLLLLAALAWGVAVVSLERGNQARREWQAFPKPLERPIPPQLTRVSLMAALADEARMAADWAYIDCLQYLGNNLNRLDGRYRQAEALYREVLWLDPGFTHAVLEGATVLGWVLRRVPQAQAYMEESIRIMPDAGRMRLYLAALAYAQKEDSVAIVETLRQEVLRPDAPEMLQRMVGNIYIKEKDWEGAIKYFSWLQGRARERQTLDLCKRMLEKARAGLAREGD